MGKAKSCFMIIVSLFTAMLTVAGEPNLRDILFAMGQCMVAGYFLYAALPDTRGQQAAPTQENLRQGAEQ